MKISSTSSFNVSSVLTQELMVSLMNPMSDSKDPGEVLR